MKLRMRNYLPITVLSIAITMSISAATAASKPLKVYILAGQSNMQGKARVRTIERLNLTEDSKSLYKHMVGKDGKPVTVKDTYASYLTASRSGEAVRKGPLSPSYGGGSSPNQSFGPEFTFGIYMQKHLNEPILIIKTAWGGKNLLQQFRPPSGGDFEKEKDKQGAKTSHYYRLMMDHVKKVLADPGQYHPAYDKAAGYEIAGFVWFQGYNDLVGPYPKTNPAKGKKSSTDWSEYSRLLACFIRDVRGELKVPKMPFVIGVIGIGGELKQGNRQQAFREAMAAPASMEEFKGTVSAVRTGQFWDMKLVALQKRLTDATKKAVLARSPELKHKPRALAKIIGKMQKATAKKVLTKEEQHFLKVAISNAEYHYNGSAYTYGKIGKAFADSMANLQGLKVKEK